MRARGQVECNFAKQQSPMKIRRALAVISVAAIGFPIAYFLLVVTASLRQGYSWSEMDWTQAGSTSLSDFLAAADIGKREVITADQRCTEYYAYKDGLAIKTVCQATR